MNEKGDLVAGHFTRVQAGKHTVGDGPGNECRRVVSEVIVANVQVLDVGMTVVYSIQETH